VAKYQKALLKFYFFSVLHTRHTFLLNSNINFLPQIERVQRPL